MIKELSQKGVQAFIKSNENADPFELSLRQKFVFDLPVQEIANQIAARKKAKNKLPEWHAAEGIIWPPLLSMEQCSSELTARYKASIISGKTLLDLTGGTGIDIFYLSKGFDHTTYVERSLELCELAQHNFNILQNNNTVFINNEAEKFIKAYDKTVSAIFIDPARRDENKNKVFLWSDCAPNIVALQSSLLDKADAVLIKASPMLDIMASLQELRNVAGVHVVSVRNECKEVLYLLKKTDVEKPPVVKTINFLTNGQTDTFEFTYDQEKEISTEYGKPQAYLYEPDTSILKAGAFKSVGHNFGLQKLHPHTHLYTSEKLVRHFPGRIFKIKAVCSFNKKAVLKHLPDKKANIAVRNFPDDVNTIRKKTGIKSGGDIYVFGATDINDQKVMIITEKID